MKLTKLERERTLRVDEILQDLSEGDRDLVVMSLMDEGWSDEYLAQALTLNGYKVGKTAVRAWRLTNRVQRFTPDKEEA